MTEPARPRLPCAGCVARRASFCAALPDDQMHRLYALAVEQGYAAGALVLREEQPADHVFSIREGHAALSRLAASGKRQILAFLFPGDFFGFTSEENYHYGVTALTPLAVCRFERAALEALIRAHPVMDRKLRFTFTRALDAAYELLFSLGRKDATQKVASFLWYASYRQRKLGRRDNPVELPMRRADIADFMGLTTETVSRALAALRRQGLVRIDVPGRVEILDMARLRAVGVVVAEPAPFVHRDPDYWPRKTP